MILNDYPGQTSLWSKVTGLMILFIYLSLTSVLAQIPEGVPKPQDNEPVSFKSPSDLIIYVILPAVLIIIYLIILYRRRKKGREEKREND
jgi:hypothetical protein